MKNAAEMLAFVRGQTPHRFAASPLLTAVLTQAMYRHDWLKTSVDPQTIDDICGIGRQCGFIPFFEVLWFEAGVIDYSEVREEIHGDTRDLVKTFRTPLGEFVLVDTFARYHSRSVSKYAFVSADDLDGYEYVIRRSLDRVGQCRARLKAVMDYTAGRAVPYFAALDPLHCFGLMENAARICFCLDQPQRMQRICELNAELSEAAIRIAAEVGFQFFFSGTESSLYSPSLLETFSLPFLVRRRELVHRLGGLFYLHECGRMQGLLDNRFYQRLAPDLLEGFQAPPSGDILDLGAATAQLPGQVVTKGNLDLNFLMRATPSEVKEAGLRMLDTIPPGRRHILGGACCIMPGTPLENLAAIVAAVEEGNRR